MWKIRLLLVWGRTSSSKPTSERVTPRVSVGRGHEGSKALAPPSGPPPTHQGHTLRAHQPLTDLE